MNPFDIAPLITNLLYKIESVAYNTEVDPASDKIRGVMYVGTSDSQVIRYNVMEGKQPCKTGRMSQYLLKAPPGEIPAISANTTLRKYAVTRLEVVPEHKVVLALCGQELYILDSVTLAETAASRTWKEKDKYTPWKSCVALAVEKPRKLSGGAAAANARRLCVLCGRGKKIALYDWMRGEYEFNREITLSEQCYSAEWCGAKHLALTTKKDVLLVDIGTGRITVVRIPVDLPPSTSPSLSSSSAASAGGSGSGSLAMATVDGTLFVARGAACYVLSLDGAAVKWAQRSVDGEDACEAKPFSRFGSACNELVVEYPYIIGLQEQNVEIQYLETTSLVQALSFHDKFPFRIMKCGPFKRVLLATTTSVYMITMKTLDAQVDEFINLSQYREAIDLFQYSRMEAALGDDPDNDAKLESICLRSFEALLRASRFSEAFDYFIMSHASPTVLLSWFPDLCSRDRKEAKKGDIAVKDGKNAHGEKNNVRAIIAVKLSKPEESPEVASEYSSVEAQLKDTLRVFKKRYNEEEKGERGKEGNNVGNNGCSTPEDVRAVNTALLLLYVNARSDALDGFVAARPRVDFALCKERLVRGKCWNALGLLYCAEGLEEDALKTWRDAKCSVTNAVDLLIHTKDARLVWEYAPWILSKNLLMGMRIFVPSGVSPASAALEGVDSAEVVAFLEAHTKDGTRAYLDYLVSSSNNNNSSSNAAGQRDEYYEKLATIYVDQSLEALAAPNAAAETEAAVTERKKALLRACRSLKALLMSKSKHAEAAARTVLARYDERFGKDIPMGAHREISVVKVAAYEKLGRPEDVLHVMIWEIGCQRRAENYCLENRTPEETSHLLCALVRACFEYDMRLYGIGSDGKKQKSSSSSLASPIDGEADLTVAFSKRALGLLCLYGARISPLEVLAGIPGATPIASLLPYFKSSLKQFSHNKCESEVKRSLSKANQLNEKCELVGIETDSFIRITDKTVCAQCQKLIGNSVFVKMPPPSGDIICFKCYDAERNRKSGKK